MSAGLGKKASESVQKEQMQYKSEDEKEGRGYSIVHEEIQGREIHWIKKLEYVLDVSCQGENN